MQLFSSSCYGPVLGALTQGTSHTIFYTSFLSVSATQLIHSTLSCLSLNFFPPNLILAVTASCSTPPQLNASPKYENFVIFYIILLLHLHYPSTVTSPSFSALSVEPQHFLHTKSAAVLRPFRILEQHLFAQMLHLVHELSYFPCFFLQTEFFLQTSRKVTIYLLISCNTIVRIAQNICIHNSNKNCKKLTTTTMLIKKRISI